MMNSYTNFGGILRSYLTKDIINYNKKVPANEIYFFLKS